MKDAYYSETSLGDNDSVIITAINQFRDTLAYLLSILLESVKAFIR